MTKICKTCHGMGKVEVEITDEEYEQMLNESYGEVKICGYTFDSGRALKELDPIAFDTGMAEVSKKEKCDDCDGEGEIEDEEEVA